MSGFSASDAALEGFQVLRKQWRIVLGWCLFSVLAFVITLLETRALVRARRLGAEVQAAERRMRQANERIASCVAVKERQSAAFARWLSAPGSAR